MSTPRLSVAYFDGRSARAQSAEIWLQGGELHIEAEANLRFKAHEVRWPERQTHGERQAHLPGGGLITCAQAAAWDGWARASGLAESHTVRWMQSWRHVALSLTLMVAVLGATWRWGTPLAADAALRVMPASVEETIGKRSLSYVDGRWLTPSELSEEDQNHIRQRFSQMVAATYGAQAAPRYTLHFRAAAKEIGPNAFALPGGDVVLTDALVELMREEPDAVLGVLAHELGHVKHRHGMRMAVQASMVGALAGLIVGDFSNVLAAIPALLAQQSYSRDFERQADEHARLMLRNARISPTVMVRFFERIRRLHEAKGELPMAFSSHPADAERIAFFSN